MKRRALWGYRGPRGMWSYMQIWRATDHKSEVEERFAHRQHDVAAGQQGSKAATTRRHHPGNPGKEDTTGLMVEDHADELLQKVQQSRQNEEYLLDLLRNQSSVQDATVQVMKNQNEVIWGNFNIINTAMYSMKNALNTAIDHEVFLDAYETLSMAMDAFERLQRDIINIIWNTNGNFLDSLLPTTQFQKQIQRIVLNMPEGVQLPTLDPLELGRISKITTRTTSSAILFN
ncbi:hypothetical protein ACLKA7_000662, partial [Drosophila subpalustris]